MSRVRRKQHKRPKRSRFHFLMSWRTLYRLRYIFGFFCFGMMVGYLVMFENGPKIIQTSKQFFYALSQKMGFEITHISFDGLEKTATKDILKKGNIIKGQSIFSIDLPQARQTIETLPWVHTAMLFRRLPNHIHIRISERHPNALWQKGKKIYLIDEYGQVIEHLSKADYAGLLLVVGEEAPAQAASLIQELKKFPDIEKKVQSAVNYSGRRWDLILKNNVRIKLPEDGMNQALSHLNKLDKEHDLTKGDIRVIDIRLKNRSFFYMSPKTKKTKFDHNEAHML